MSEPAPTPTPAAAAAPAADAASSSSPAAAPAPAPLPPTDNLTKMMLEKSLHTLGSHPALATRGQGMLLRNLYGILFGPMFAQSWEMQIMREEQKNTKVSFQRTNEASLKRLKSFFEGKKARSTSGSSLSLALLNPSAKTESFDHRMLLVWLGGRLFKIDGQKRTGIPGFTNDQTTWPVGLSEVEKGGEELWKALQTFIPAGKPVGEWDATKAAAWDTIVSQPGKSTPFGSAIVLKGQQTFCCVTSEEEGLRVDLKNGLVERLKAITVQLNAMA